MELPLAPVEAAADDRSSLRLELREIDSKRLAATLRSRSDCVVPVAANDDALPLQSRGKLDAEAAGEMVVAGARGAERLGPSRLAWDRWEGRALVASGRRAVYALFATVAVCFGILLVAFVRSDFSFALVASHSSTTTPSFYRATAI